VESIVQGHVAEDLLAKRDAVGVNRWSAIGNVLILWRDRIEPSASAFGVTGRFSAPAHLRLSDRWTRLQWTSARDKALV
jgi:hypothetical protein